MTYQLGADVGGTFTDLLLIDDQTGETHRVKTPSTPSDQSQAVVDGIEKICGRAGIEPGQVAHLLHGSTVATNAILQSTGVRVGLVTTQGFRQVLQIARSFVPGGLGGWIVWPKPTPLAPLEATTEAKERIGSGGEVLVELDEKDLRTKLRGLRDEHIEALTVALINSFTNTTHERRVEEIAAEELPDIPVSLSSHILPELREYERTLTTVANSYVRPVASRYLGALQQQLATSGLDAKLRVLRSDGGLAPVALAEAAPVSMLMSGPAGGVSGAVWAAGQAGHSNLLTLDMGGTSTDVALVENGSPRMGRDTQVGNLTVRASSVDVRTVGAGGGSIAHVPELTKALRIGPQSAGAEPGPVAYGKGGKEPTVTDANIVLGYLPPRLIGGEMALDSGAAEHAIKDIANATGLPDAKHAAAGIIDIVNENMSGALRLVSVQQGYDSRDFALVAFGGAGPMHGNALARLMGSWPVIVPPSPGVLSAYGQATTVLRNEEGRTFIRRFSETSDTELRQNLDELASTARADLDAEGVPRSSQVITYQVDVRYHGQGFEHAVDVEESLLQEGSGRGLGRIGELFDAEHEQLFMFSLNTEHELVNLRASAKTQPPDVEPPTLEQGSADASAARDDAISLWIDGADVDGALYDRSRLRAGNVVPGPAVIAELDSTTLVLPDHHASVDSFGNLLIRPNSEE